MTIQATLLFATLALWPSLATSTTVLPVVRSQPFDVTITSASLTDTDRLDPFARDGRARSIMVSSFNPISTCHRKHVEPYMPPITAAFQDDKFAAYGLPNGSFRALNLETCANGSTNHSPCSSSYLPVVLFSGGLGTSRLLYTSILQNIAGAGYLVVSIDHPYDSDIVEFPNGTVITGIDISSDAEVDLALSTRAKDLAFMRQQLANVSVTERLFPGQLRGRHSPKAAAIGHSLGGAAAAEAMLIDPAIVAGLNLDGSMFGDVLTAGLDRSFMLMGHENKTQETDPSWKAIWPQLKGWKKEFEVRGAAHYSFSDLPLITTVLGLQDKLPAEVAQVLGTVEGHHMTNIIASYVTSFLDMALKSGSGDLLNGGSVEFPEVEQVA